AASSAAATPSPSRVCSTSARAPVRGSPTPRPRPRARRTSGAATADARDGARSRPQPGSADRQVRGPPPQDVLEPCDPVLGGAGAGQLVTLAREQQQLGGHALALEPDVPALPLLDRAAPVLLGVDDERRRPHLVDVRHRALRSDGVGVLAQVPAAEEPADVAGAGEAHRVEEAALDDRARPPVVARGEPGGHVAAVGAAHDADAVAVERTVARESTLEELQDVGGVALPETADDRPAVLLPVARRAARVAEDDGVARPDV